MVVSREAIFNALIAVGDRRSSCMENINYAAHQCLVSGEGDCQSMVRLHGELIKLEFYYEQLVSYLIKADRY